MIEPQERAAIDYWNEIGNIGKLISNFCIHHYSPPLEIVLAILIAELENLQSFDFGKKTVVENLYRE
jgi:hypothetical protein